jgi:hypothetical protein
MPRSDEELSGLRKVLTLQMVKHWRALVLSERKRLYRRSTNRRNSGPRPFATRRVAIAVTGPRTLLR